MSETRNPDCEVCITREAAASCAAQDELIDEFIAQYYLAQGRELGCKENWAAEARRFDEAERVHAQEKEKARKSHRRAMVTWVFVAAGAGYVAGRVVGGRR